MTKYDIFISYSHMDKEIVHATAHKLEDNGFDVWIDWEGIYSGDLFKRKIAQAIIDSDVFLFFSSAASNTSHWTEKEINTASELKKKIIPVRLDKTPYNVGVMLDLISLDYVDFTNHNAQNAQFNKLLKSLRNICRKHDSPAPEATQQTSHQVKEDDIIRTGLYIPSPNIEKIKEHYLKIKSWGNNKQKVLNQINTCIQNTSVERYEILSNGESLLKINPEYVVLSFALIDVFKELGATVEIVTNEIPKDGECGINLDSIGTSNKLSITRTLRSHFNLNLKDAVYMIDNCIPLKIRIDHKGESKALAKELCSIGAVASYYEIKQPSTETLQAHDPSGTRTPGNSRTTTASSNNIPRSNKKDTLTRNDSISYSAKNTVNEESLVQLSSKAIAFYETGDYKSAFPLFIKLAQKGSSVSWFYLGVMYEKGQGVIKNESEALKWYRKAAERGDIAAQNNLGLMYKSRQGIAKNDSEAIKWFRMAAEQGYANAQFNLGTMHAEGQGVDKNLAEAVKWYRKAADKGNAAAQFNLGAMYDKGREVAKNETVAVKWYRKAAEQGHAEAQYNLGLRYENGRGVPKNDKKAVEWYQKAAEQGRADAQFNLGLKYAYGNGVAKSDSEAVKWYRKAAEQGHAGAQFNLGLRYAYGQGVAQSENEAARWFRKAASQGYKPAVNYLNDYMKRR